MVVGVCLIFVAVVALLHQTQVVEHTLNLPMVAELICVLPFCRSFLTPIRVMQVGFSTSSMFEHPGLTSDLAWPSVAEYMAQHRVVPKRGAIR